MQPLAPEQYRIQFTATQFTHDKLRRAQDLLRHLVPNGDPAEIFDRALALLNSGRGALTPGSRRASAARATGWRG